MGSPLRENRGKYSTRLLATLLLVALPSVAWAQAPSETLPQRVRRIVLHLPATCAHRHDWQIIARQLGAAPA